jgi:hypothetical protein
MTLAAGIGRLGLEVLISDLVPVEALLASSQELLVVLLGPGSRAGPVLR